MDTSSPFAISRAPAELESVSLSQLLAHIRASDQREAFVQEIILNSPACSVATTRSSTRSPTRSSFVSRSSKRSGFIVCKRNSSDSESDNETAITCSSIASVSGRSTGGAAIRKSRRSRAVVDRSKNPLHSGWFDDEDEANSSGEEYDSGDDQSISLIAERAHGRSGQLSPSKRSIEDLKNLSIFDPTFSFSRSCVTSPIESELVSPLDSWYS